MNCSNCAAPLPPRTDRCSYCGTLNDVDLRALRGATAGGPSERSCPRCRETMATLSLPAGDARIVVERCERCLGMFFDPGELDDVLDGSRLAPRSDDVDHERLDTLVADRGRTEAIEYVRCPVCDTLMNRKTFGAKSGVIVDRCKGHGVWLDGGELARLLRWHAAGGSTLARRRELERVAAEAAREADRARFQPLVLRTPEGSGADWTNRFEGGWMVADLLGFLTGLILRRW